MRVLVCGDRNWTDRETIRTCLKPLPKKHTIIVHGACRGADRIAGEIAQEMGFEVEEYPAEWERYGRAAGPIRNKQMLNTGVDLVIAFHDDLRRSKGTRNMVEQAWEKNVKVHIVNEDGTIHLLGRETDDGHDS